jgi:hypothetical protein
MFVFENFKKRKTIKRKANIRISLKRKSILVSKEEIKMCKFFTIEHKIFDSDIDFLRCWHYHLK